ncbi:T9SS type B sorting domain-containing protein [Tenacibaculum crassostreae]|uniref:T9SS type B sorting domain-containing protein n=1 Tax=Tenacibaculum crassostreae TaxID=502683 RepID=UPI003894E18B
MKKTSLFLNLIRQTFLYILILNSSTNLFSQNGSSTCSSLEPMCSDNNGIKIFDNVINTPSIGSYGCLFDSPNPAWFFIKVQSTGNLNFEIIQATNFDSNGNVPIGERELDVDFIAWGPFDTPDSNCNSLSRQCFDLGGSPIACVDNVASPNFYINDNDNSNIIDCSYSGNTRESFTIPNAQAGKFYILLVTNYSGESGKIKLQQSNFNQSNSGTTDCSIVAGELGPDQTKCEGETVTITTTTNSVNPLEYSWSVDSGSGFNTIPGETSSSLTISNNISGTYKVEITDTVTGSTGEDEVVITFLKVPTINQPNNILFCDTDNDGLNVFDLQSTVTPQILNGEDPAIFEVVYYLTQADADGNNTANAITNPYTNPTPFSNQTIYARMHNKVAPNACYDVKTFTLAVTGLPTPKQPLPYDVCDDTVSGSDTDGIFNNFILNSKDSEILDALDPNLYEVSYHTSLSGAQTDKNTDVIDKNAPYTNTSVNSQRVFVRVENKNNPACNDVTRFLDLVVNPLPIIANPIVTLKQCDTDADLNTTINLTLAEISISNNSANETFKYYPSLLDANNDTNEITNTTAHPVTHGDKFWARTISNKGCYRVSEINIIVGFAADITYNRQFEECDDFLDSDGNKTTNNNDTDGITNFDISDVPTEVKNLFPIANRPNLDVLIFETIADRDAVQNQITNLTNYRNKNVPATTPQSLYIKVIDKTNNDCQGIGDFTIWAQQPPIANTVSPIEQCDDFDSGAYDDGININLDLRSKATSILGTQNSADYTVTFHTSSNDANTGNNPIANDDSYTNQTRDKETIYVRVVNNTTGCFNDHTSFDIIINPLPIITKPIPNIEVCDDGSDGSSINGLAQNIDLSQRDVDVLDGRDPNMYSVTYHRTRQNAIDGTFPLSKNNYANNPTYSTPPPAGSGIDAPHTEVLWISVLNTTTQCRYGLATITIVTYPEPILPINITDYTNCDNTNDSSNDDTNGINGDITLSAKIPEILVNYPTSEHSNFTVTFHETLTDAQTGDNPLNENQYENTTTNQTIYVRVQNKKTTCINDDLSFNIVINPLPDFTVNTPVIVCLGEQVRLEALNPAATYTYKWYKNGDPTNVRSTDIFYDVAEAGDYYVVATTTNGTNCERRRDIHVDPSEKPTINTDDIVIVDDTNNSRLDNYSITIITENNNLGIGNYEFSLIDEYENQTPFQDEAVFENIKGGIYTIVIQDKNGCQPNATIDVSVIEYPKFITPNGDGDNDTWRIKGANSNFFPSSSIYIFDRHGKVVGTFPIDGEGWNGIYNSKPLPSSDYWFKIQLVDRKGKLHQHQGHFSLIRK